MDRTERRDFLAVHAPAVPNDFKYTPEGEDEEHVGEFPTKEEMGLGKMEDWEYRDAMWLASKDARLYL
jgi:hypothetical protein